jgi:tRNA (cmo5U34)-methyltransferase
VRSCHGHFQEICTQIYEDFKFNRGYSKTEIFRKKEALMNILVPYTEEELLNVLVKEIGFDHAQVIVK